MGAVTEKLSPQPAPGAQDTIMVLALTLHLDLVYVGAHHLARFLVVTFAIAVAARSYC